MRKYFRGNRMTSFQPGLLADVDLLVKPKPSLYGLQQELVSRRYFFDLVCKRLREEPDFRAHVRSALADLPADQPGRRSVLSDEQVYMLVEIGRRYGARQREAMQEVALMYRFKLGTLVRKYWAGKKKVTFK